MQKGPLILIVSGLVLFSLLYFGGDMVGDKKNTPPGQHEHNDTENAGMNAANSVEAIRIDNYIKDARLQLKPDALATLTGFEEQWSKQESPVNGKNLAEFWEKEKDLNIAAHYYKKAAFLENTEKSITFAGNLFLAILQKTEKPEIRKWQSLEAIECFEKALQLNPSNTDTKIALATCYTEGTGETMKGVTLLREITAKDSANIPANMVLGKLAIQSGQFDKAVKRLELVLSIEPKNSEAMYFLAEAYKGKGDKTKALELFEKCKTLVNNPEFSKEIDTYINSFK